MRSKDLSMKRLHGISSIQYFLSLFTFLLLMNHNVIVCAPAHDQRHRDPDSKSLQNYLLKYGYLPQSGLEIREQVSEKRMKEAIRELQAFANIEVTGEIDEKTRFLIEKPRCGVPDVLSGQFNSNRRYKRFIIQGQKWPSTNLTWSLKKSSHSHHERDIIEELSKALQVWSRSTPLSFKRLPNNQADRADISIVFTTKYHEDGYPFDGKGAILAHAFFPGTGQGGDAHFDDDEVWIVHSRHEDDYREGTRLFSVAAHEFGHSLGLSHSDVEGALMYPWYQNFDSNITLSRDDLLGIHRIYGGGSKWTSNPYPSGTGNEIPRVRPKPRKPPRRPSIGRPIYPHGGAPKTCDSSYDAVSLIRDELFIFKGKYFWRINSTPNENRLLKGYPCLITNMWRKLPFNLSHVDAVFENNDIEIVFFIGRQYWRFRGTELMRGYPRSLSSMGISDDVTKIDGVMTWGHNGRTYMFSGSRYWRLRDGVAFQVEPDYPRDMHVWKGVPNSIDSVLRWKDDNVYFFKGKYFWKFNDKYMEVEDPTPSLSAPFWMGCPDQPQDGNKVDEQDTEKPTSLGNLIAKNSVLTLASSMLSLSLIKRLL